MAQSRNERAAGGPAGWVILLGLMVLALVIAAASKGCSDDTTTVGAGGTSPATTSTATTAGTGSAKAQEVIAEITAQVTNNGGIQFTTGRAELTEASRTTLDKVAQILARNPTVKAEIQGHTDTQGEEAKNLTLSDERAKSVRDYLIQKGVKATQLTAKGYGEAEPKVTPESTDEDRKKNRRVEFKLIP